MRRKQFEWQDVDGPHLPAKQIWKLIYGEPWPTGWQVKWGVRLGGKRMGLCRWSDKTIVLDYEDAAKGHVGGVFDTLIHEFIHLRYGYKGIRHGKEFTRLVQWGLNRLMATPQAELEEEAA